MQKNGGYIWIQSCATIAINAKNANEKNIIWVNYLLRYSALPVPVSASLVDREAGRGRKGCELRIGVARGSPDVAHGIVSARTFLGRKWLRSLRAELSDRCPLLPESLGLSWKAGTRLLQAALQSSLSWDRRAWGQATRQSCFPLFKQPNGLIWASLTTGA